MEDKVKKIIAEINKLIAKLDNDGIYGPIGYLESCLDELQMAQKEIELFFEDNEENDES